MNSKKRIKILIDVLEKSKINSMEVSSFWGFLKIKLTKDSIISEKNIKTKPQLVESDIKEENIVNTDQSDENRTDILDKETILSDEQIGHIQKAPLVGTVYLSPKEGEDNFINEGDKIKKGQVICIIEAMKIFNEIESDKNGVVKKIYVQNESPVEFGQDLIEII